MDFQCEDLELNEKKVVELTYKIGSHTIKNYFTSNTENEVKNVCGYLTRDINQIILGALIKKNPHFGFMGNMMFSFIEPIEAVVNLNTGKVEEVFYNGNKFDESMLNDKITTSIFEHDTLANMMLAFDPLNPDNLSQLNNDENQVPNDMKKMLGSLLGSNLEQDEDEEDEDEEDEDEEDEDEEDDDEEDDEEDDEDNKNENTDENESNWEDVEDNSSNESDEPEESSSDVGKIRQNMFKTFDPNTINSMLGGLGGLDGLDFSGLNLGGLNLGGLNLGGLNLGGLEMKASTDNPMNILGNIANIWTNEYYDVKEQEDLDDFLIKDDEDNENENDNENDDKNDESKSVIESSDNLTKEIEDEEDNQLVKNLFEMIDGKSQNQIKLTKYLKNNHQDIAVEVMFILGEEIQTKIREFVDKIFTQEQYDNLISIYKTRLTGTEVNIPSPIGNSMKGFQEIRTDENGSEYIYNKISLNNDDIEIVFNYEMMQILKTSIIKILDLA